MVVYRSTGKCLYSTPIELQLNTCALLYCRRVPVPALVPDDADKSKAMASLQVHAAGGAVLGAVLSGKKPQLATCGRDDGIIMVWNIQL